MEWFKTIDLDGSGKIDLKELKAVVKALYDYSKEDVGEARLDADVAVRRFTYFKTNLN